MKEPVDDPAGSGGGGVGVGSLPPLPPIAIDDDDDDDDDDTVGRLLLLLPDVVIVVVGLGGRSFIRGAVRMSQNCPLPPPPMRVIKRVDS